MQELQRRFALAAAVIRAQLSERENGAGDDRFYELKGGAELHGPDVAGASRTQVPGAR